MADKPLEIHDDALAELKSALRWYLERSESAADGFVAEIDRAIALITRLPHVGLPVNAARGSLFSRDFLTRLSIGKS